MATSEQPSHSVSRLAQILNVLADNSATGLRLTDIVEKVGLSKGAVHRYLAALAEHGMVEQDVLSGRHFLGMNMIVWAASASKRYGLASRLEPALQRLAEKTQDTIYLMLRTGDEAVCIARLTGSYPIKTLTINVGSRRFLGVGAGPLAILSHLKDDEILRILNGPTAEGRRAFFSDTVVWQMITRTRFDGFATVGDALFPGLSGVALPILGQDGNAIAAINVVAITERMSQDRRFEIALEIRKEIEKFKQDFALLLTPAGIQQLSNTSIPLNI